jgi:co-chaperonin GroES (HSP10)
MMPKDLGEHGKQRLEEIAAKPDAFEGYKDMVVREDERPPDETITRIFKKVRTDHLIVRIDEPLRKVGRVIIPGNKQTKPTTAVVLLKDSRIPDSDIAVGDRVLFGQYSGTLLKFKGAPYCRSITSEEVIAVLNDETPELEMEGA